MTDLKSRNVSVAAITETHYKQKRADSVVNIDGYTIFRRGRTGRRRGGVALYVKSDIQSSAWSSSTAAENRAFELLWVCVTTSLFVGTIYHPPRPL